MTCDKPSILLVEDDAMLAELVKGQMDLEGFDVTVAGTGSQALEILSQVEPGLIILDVRLPDMDGISLCRQIRRTRRTPILFLSGCAEDIDKVVGLEVGADDYLAKPFNPRELLARVRALLRRWLDWGPMRAESDEAGRLQRGGLDLDLKGLTATLEGRELALTTLEFSILRLLAENAGRVLNRQQILDGAWGPDFFGDERTVDAHIRNLRAKMRAVSHSEIIVSVRGVGYKLVG
ncbi:MAG: DNA-binding response regulator [Candidatus Xenobia bacterium]